MIMKKLAMLFMAAIPLLVACKKEDPDIEAPVITTYKINEADHDIEVAAGTEMHVDLVFTDNEELREYKIDIHDAFDGHEHGKVNAITRFSFQQTYAINGKQATEHQEVNVPAESAAGPYHAIVRVIDLEGNEGEFGELIIHITHPDQPVINVTSPDFSNEVHAPKGSAFTLSGTITDNNDLEEIFIVIKEEEEHNHGKVQAGELYEADFDLPGADDTSWDFSEISNQGKDIVIPATAETGHYILEVVAKDAEGHMTIWEQKIHVM